MANLLPGLLGGGAPMGGLLSPEMAMASQLLQASGPSRMPVSTGQALGQGIDAYGRAQAAQSVHDMQQRTVAMREQQAQQQAQQAQAEAQRQAMFQQIMQLPESQRRAALMQAGFVDEAKKLTPDIKSMGGGYVVEDGQMRYDPALAAALQSSAKAGATNITLGPDNLPLREQVLLEDAKARSDDARSVVTDVIKSGRDAVKGSADYDRALNLLDTVATGPLEEAKLAAKRYANALGMEFDADKVASAEELQVLFGNQIMSRVAETKGAVSDREMRLFQEYSANFGKTTQGNKRILQFKKEKASRDRELAKMARKMQDQGRTSIEIERAIWDYVEQNPIDDVLAEQPVPQEPANVVDWSTL